MAFIRRIKVKCAVCPNILIKRDGDTDYKLKKRKTCSDACAEIYRNIKKTHKNVCFCGQPQNRDNYPYCSWDHRIIAIKCKRWGIESSLLGYKERAAQLDAAQREIDVKFLNV